MRHWAIVNLVLAVLVFGCGDTTETQVIPDDTPAPSDGGNSDSGTTNPDGTIGEDTAEMTWDDNNSCTYSTSIQNPGGKLHGEPCETNADCAYGICHQSDSISAGKFCTKNCGPCGPGSACGDDDANGLTFDCTKFTKSAQPNETIMSICTQECVNAGDCPMGFTNCKVITGVQKICTTH